jgi:hypothetical protein
MLFYSIIQSLALFGVAVTAVPVFVEKLWCHKCSGPHLIGTKGEGLTEDYYKIVAPYLNDPEFAKMYQSDVVNFEKLQSSMADAIMAEFDKMRSSLSPESAAIITEEMAIKYEKAGYTDIAARFREPLESTPESEVRKLTLRKQTDKSADELLPTTQPTT